MFQMSDFSYSYSSRFRCGDYNCLSLIGNDDQLMGLDSQRLSRKDEWSIKSIVQKAFWKNNFCNISWLIRQGLFLWWNIIHKIYALFHLRYKIGTIFLRDWFNVRSYLSVFFKWQVNIFVISGPTFTLKKHYFVDVHKKVKFNCLYIWFTSKKGWR